MSRSDLPSFLNVWKFPLSGDVEQDIRPNLATFFAGIDPRSGDGRMERLIFERASYGRQIGYLTKAVLELAGDKADSSDALKKLKEVAAEIEAIKKDEAAYVVKNLESQLRWLKKSNAKEYKNALARLNIVENEEDTGPDGTS